MQVQPRRLTYVPTLALRASEMNGLEKLPGPTKDRLQPNFLLAPWPNALTLDKAIDRINKAFPNRAFCLDLDRDYVGGAEAPAKNEFNALKRSANSYRSWHDFVCEQEHVTPCLQHIDQTSAELKIQIERYQAAGKTFYVRLMVGRDAQSIDPIVDALNAVGSSDYFVILEGGWCRDVLSQQAVMSGLVGTALARLSADVPIVLSATSIPKGFETVQGIMPIPFENRELILALTAQHNFRQFVYGDWGSTRPRTYERAGPPRPRVDYPSRKHWLIARNKPEDWSFQTAAAKIIATPTWVASKGLGIWGEEMIIKTSRDEALGINSPQKNVAARVNIHLHIQAFYDQADIRGLNLDEPWVD